MVERPEHRHPRLGHAPDCASRSRRKASAELPSVNTSMASRYRWKGRPSPASPGARPSAARRRAPRRLPDPRHQGHEHRHAGDRRQEEHLSEIESGAHQQRRGCERAHDGAGVVHGAVEAKAAPRISGAVTSAMSASRGEVDALPHPVGEPQRQHLRPGAGQADEGAGHRGQPVAGEEHGLAPPHPVGEDARHQLERRGGGLGHPLDEPDHPRARAHGRGQEQRQQRVDHLAGQVGEEAHQPERHHRRRQPLGVGRGLVHAGRELRNTDCTVIPAKINAGRRNVKAHPNRG